MKISSTRSGHTQSERRITALKSKGRTGQRFRDNRTISAFQRETIRSVQQHGGAASQMKFVEPEPVQAKTAVQRLASEEEELMQGKNVAQRQFEDEDELQMKSESAIQCSLEDEEEMVQQKSYPSAVPVQKAANRTGMPDHVKARMESSFNTDFSNVNVHPESGKASEVGALAYTQGSDIHFAPGQFQPDTSQGKKLLGHELAHVVQQRQGRVRPTTEVNGMPVNDNPTLEQEADNLGSKA
jgi:hypothetical protein